MRPQAIYTAVVGAGLLVWIGVGYAEALAQPVLLLLLTVMAALVAAAAATYQWRTLLLVIVTSVLSGTVLGIGIAVALLEPTAPIWGAGVAFVFGGLGAVWASHRRPVKARQPSGRRDDLAGSPTA